MKRKNYKSIPADTDKLPRWLQKVAKDDGETERMKRRERDREREKQTSGNLKQSEKIVKREERIREMSTREVRESGCHDYKTERGAKNENNDKRRKYRIGNGLEGDLEIVMSGKNDKAGDEINGGKSERSRKAVQIAEERNRKNVKRKECKGVLKKANENSRPVNAAEPEEVPSWPICRFSMKDSVRFSLQKPIAQSMPETTVHQVIPEATSFNTVNIVMTDSEVKVYNKSFISRVVSLFRFVFREQRKMAVH